MTNKLDELAMKLASAVYYAEEAKSLNASSAKYFNGMLFGVCEVIELMTGEYPYYRMRDFDVEVRILDYVAYFDINTL